MLTDEEKREVIEKALGQFGFVSEDEDGIHTVLLDSEALAEEAIVFDGFIFPWKSQDFTTIEITDGRGGKHLMGIKGLRSKPGKAIAIIIPNEEASDEGQD